MTRKSKTRKRISVSGKKTRKDKWRNELMGIMAMGSYVPAWFWITYGKERGSKIYSRKQKALDKREKFLRKKLGKDVW